MITHNTLNITKTCHVTVNIEYSINEENACLRYSMNDSGIDCGHCVCENIEESECDLCVLQYGTGISHFHIMTLLCWDQGNSKIHVSACEGWLISGKYFCHSTVSLVKRVSMIK
jgi:hypothetical protein